jgi:hypothetical protein
LRSEEEEKDDAGRRIGNASLDIFKADEMRSKRRLLSLESNAEEEEE